MDVKIRHNAYLNTLSTITTQSLLRKSVIRTVVVVRKHQRDSLGVQRCRPHQ